MPGRKDYESAVRRAVDLYEEKTGTDVLQYIERTGLGEPPKYVFLWKTCLGGPEALRYVEGLLEGLEAGDWNGYKAEEEVKFSG